MAKKVGSDIEIAQEATMKPIIDLAGQKFGIPKEELDPYGHYKAKLSMKYIDSLAGKKEGKLILVTAMSPTPAGEGKTTTTVGLSDALNYIGKTCIGALREPSLGPVFGVKGGAAGGGYAQVVPMEDINLHFTGDFHAIAAAHNLLSAMIDNHIHQGNALNIDPRLITWPRVVDMNDRALRKLVIGMGGRANGFMRDDMFKIVVASEIMAIFCLATSIKDLKERLGRIIIGHTNAEVKDRKPIYAKDLNAHGAMTALLKDALKPNVVQTLENNVMMIHGGPFANIAHGCNSYLATKTAMQLVGEGGYVVTEAGFGADLGAEKFLDIKCRMTGLNPSCAVIVCTVKALKHHGGCGPDGYKVENLEALKKGFANLDKHLQNIQENYGLPVVVSINHFYHDTEAEIKLVQDHLDELKVPNVIGKHWAAGGAGAADLAKKVVEQCEGGSKDFKWPWQGNQVHKFVYEAEADLLTKIKCVATKVYGAADVKCSDVLKRRLEKWSKEFPSFPICMAKTQSSFSDNPTIRGAPTGWILEVTDAVVSNGAGFVVVMCGDIMTMPGLPKVPAAEKIDVDENGVISGLF
eukprot:gnl/MRDRNA2_/MRDRNA2_107220_c0_seq1.p1 gnl/MRDRNA2_/MRDRNA2_107220_c0~~gnl/MRDRNA2_/MRDRNA2_107220_c0_seq1.p1  ORF type:complete len:579 (-),score=131.58 gnl/MRDRNA2_/MRDRNA2_107220_c0_seq1:142-1878(-)